MTRFVSEFVEKSTRSRFLSIVFLVGFVTVLRKPTEKQQIIKIIRFITQTSSHHTESKKNTKNPTIKSILDAINPLIQCEI